jgi:hypothetical protein
MALSEELGCSAVEGHVRPDVKLTILSSEFVDGGRGVRTGLQACRAPS